MEWVDDFDVDLGVDALASHAYVLWPVSQVQPNLIGVMEALPQPRWNPTQPRVDATKHPAGPDLVQVRQHLYQVCRMLTGAPDQSTDPWLRTDQALGLLAYMLTDMIGLLGCWFAAGTAETLGVGNGHLALAAELHGVNARYVASAEADIQADALLAEADRALDLMWHAAGIEERRRKARARKPNPATQALLVAELIRTMVGVPAAVHRQYGRHQHWRQAAVALTHAYRAVLRTGYPLRPVEA